MKRKRKGGAAVKNLTMIVWLTQLGLSVAMPPAGCIIAAVWLRQQYGLGAWVLIVGILLGLAGAVDGLRVSLKAMDRLARTDGKK